MHTLFVMLLNHGMSFQAKLGSMKDFNLDVSGGIIWSMRRLR